MPRQTSIQLTEATERQAAALKGAGFGSLTDIIRISIDRMYREETRTMGATTITQIWQHKTSGDRFAVKVYDGDNPRELWGPLTSDQVQEVIDTVRANGNWEGSYEELLTTQGYDAAEAMIAEFAETADEYRVTWTEV